jgi:hypothetical protein
MNPTPDTSVRGQHPYQGPGSSALLGSAAAVAWQLHRS